jgi:hypothetical protein
LQLWTSAQREAVAERRARLDPQVRAKEHVARQRQVAMLGLQRTQRCTDRHGDR